MLKLVILSLLGTAFAQPINPANVPCGVPTVQPITSRIVGGVVATPGSWPWAVLVADSLGFISGSGTLIHPHVIVTSAQQFEGPGFSIIDLDLNYWRVYAGEFHKYMMNDPHERFYHINRVVLHPGYNITSLENDVALILINENIQYNDHTRPACLPDASHTYTVGEMCYLPGWSSTSNTGDEEFLNQIGLPIIADSICQTHWADFLPATELCAGYENGGKDFCGDDIGSPLMCKDQGGAWYIQGIASSGGDCKKADEPGIFEDVAMYSDWIKKTMEDAGYPYAY